jgi:YHS domain-containing protein
MKLVNSQCLIHPGQSAQLAFSAMHEGERYGFCCQGCKQMFVQEPARYLAQQP